MLAFLLAQAVTPAALPAVDPVATDGRLYGHFRYGDAPPGDLVAAPPGFGIHACMLRREVIPDLTRLIAAADAALGLGAIRGLSCHRGVLRQGSVFARGGAGPTAADRAISVAPPGHSEHSTGFALDFAVRPSHGCPDAEACMAATPQARWLHDHAPRYGFELSFPPGNQQNVKWEPWHWRCRHHRRHAGRGARALPVRQGARQLPGRSGHLPAARPAPERPARPARPRVSAADKEKAASLNQRLLVVSAHTR